MKWSDVAVQWAPALVVGALIFGYEEFVKKGPVVPDQPLVAAAKTYVKTLPEAYSAASAQVKNGVLADKKAVVASLQAHAKPLAEALDSAFSSTVDAQQHIVNAPAAADVLEQVAKAIKSEVK